MDAESVCSHQDGSPGTLKRVKHARGVTRGRFLEESSKRETQRRYNLLKLILPILNLFRYEIGSDGFLPETKR